MPSGGCLEQLGVLAKRCSIKHAWWHVHDFTLAKAGSWKLSGGLAQVHGLVASLPLQHHRMQAVHQGMKS